MFCTFFTMLNLTKSAPWNPVKNLKRAPCLPIPELDRAPHISPLHLFKFRVGGHDNVVSKAEDRTEDRPQMAANVRTTKEV